MLTDILFAYSLSVIDVPAHVASCVCAPTCRWNKQGHASCEKALASTNPFLWHSSFMELTGLPQSLA